MVKWLVLGAALAACGDPTPFTCDRNSDCSVDGVTGVCTNFNYCAFPDDTCQSGLRYHDSAGSLAGTCVGSEPPPMLINGDTGNNPLPLMPTQTVDITNANDDVTPSCGGKGGKDVFFETQIDMPSRLYLDTLGSNFDAVISVLSGSCKDGGSERACVSGACPQFDQWSDILPSGTYCIVIDQADSGGGNQLVLRSMVGPPAQQVQFGTLSGNTCNADDWQGVCSMQGLPDVTWFTMTCVAQPGFMSTCGTGFVGQLQAWGFMKQPLACDTGCQGISFVVSPGPGWLVAEADDPMDCGHVDVDYSSN